MEIIEHEDLAATRVPLVSDTITALVYLDKAINTEVVFRFLPTAAYYRFAYQQPNDYDLPIKTIKSMTYDGHTRGVNQTMGGFMLHCISINLRHTRKMVNIKASARKFHLCGLTYMEQATEVTGMLLEHIETLNAELQYVARLPEETKRATLAYIERFRGPRVQCCVKHLVKVSFSFESWCREFMQNRPSKLSVFSALHTYSSPTGKIEVTIFRPYLNQEETKVVDVMRIRWLMSRSAQEVKVTRKRQTEIIISYRENVPDKTADRSLLLPIPEFHALNIPANVDEATLRIMLRNHRDFVNFEAWYAVSASLLTATECYSGDPPAIMAVLSSMVNSHISLSFRVDLEKLAWTFANAGYGVIYDNQIVDYVSIFIPYERNEKILRKKRYDAVEFLVSASGKVTVTGPQLEINETCYSSFFNLISTNRTEITDTSYVPAPKKVKLSKIKQ